MLSADSNETTLGLGGITWSSDRSGLGAFASACAFKGKMKPSDGNSNLLVLWIVSAPQRGTYGIGLGVVTRLVALGAAVFCVAFCVAVVALGDMDLRFVWQAWHLVTSTFALCGRRGTYGIVLGLVTRLVALGAAAFCVAGVALGDMDLRFVWQVWHLVTSTFVLCEAWH
eukprot:s93_g5.t1